MVEALELADAHLRAPPPGGGNGSGGGGGFDRRHALGNAHDSALREVMVSYDVPRSRNPIKIYNEMKLRILVSRSNMS